MPWKDMDYTYDDVGNRLTEVINDNSYTYSYVPGTNIIDTVTDTDTIIYTHDANGNITGIGNKVFTYNQNNRLVMVEEDSVVLGEYTYNGLGQRIKKQVNGVTTIFHYDFDGNIIGESDASGNFSKEYLYRGNSRLALVDVETGELYYYGNDRLGTPQILTDSTNTVVWEAVYDPFGEAEVNPNSSVENNFRFPGQYFDSETGLHYNYHRYYDPATGRYLKADPIGLRGGIGLYVYVNNNAINLIDSYGLFFEKIWNDPKERSKHKKEAITMEDFLSYIEGKNLQQIQHDIDKRGRGDRSAGGPQTEYRYVINPKNPNEVIDMRHFFVLVPKENSQD
jgi:RHS repeat-associated protein